MSILDDITVVINIKENTTVELTDNVKIAVFENNCSYNIKDFVIYLPLYSYDGKVMYLNNLTTSTITIKSKDGTIDTREGIRHLGPYMSRIFGYVDIIGWITL